MHFRRMVCVRLCDLHRFTLCNFGLYAQSRPHFKFICIIYDHDSASVLALSLFLFSSWILTFNDLIFFISTRLAITAPISCSIIIFTSSAVYIIELRSLSLSYDLVFTFAYRNLADRRSRCPRSATCCSQLASQSRAGWHVPRSPKPFPWAFCWTKKCDGSFSFHTLTPSF